MKKWLELFADMMDNDITSMPILSAGPLASLQTVLFFGHRKKLHAD